MKLNLLPEQLKRLINHAKDEVLERDAAQMALAQAMNGMWNNDMNLHRVMMSTLAGAGQINITQYSGVVPMTKNATIETAFKVEDGFSEEIFKVIRKQAMYFGCFVRGANDYPYMVVDEAKDLLKIETDTVTYNDMDLQFINIIVLMDLLNKQVFELTIDKVSIKAEKQMNGGQPYVKFTLNDNSISFEGNSYEISRTCYSYDFQYKYLELALKNNHSFGNGDGNHSVVLPINVMHILYAGVSQLAQELCGELTLSDVLNKQFNDVIQTLKEIVDTCQLKFADTEKKVWTPEERIKNIRYYISERLQYSRSWSSNGINLPCLKGEDFSVSVDNTEIFFESEIPTYIFVDGHYNKSKMKFNFDHLGQSNFSELFVDKNDLTKIQDLWVFKNMNKDLQSIAYSARELRELGEFGRGY